VGGVKRLGPVGGLADTSPWIEPAIVSTRQHIRTVRILKVLSSSVFERGYAALIAAYPTSRKLNSRISIETLFQFYDLVPIVPILRGDHAIDARYRKLVSGDRSYTHQAVMRQRSRKLSLPRLLSDPVSDLLKTRRPVP